jgi:hypothetical protein
LQSPLTSLSSPLFLSQYDYEDEEDADYKEEKPKKKGKKAKADYGEIHK